MPWSSQEPMTGTRRTPRMGGWNAAASDASRCSCARSALRLVGPEARVAEEHRVAVENREVHVQVFVGQLAAPGAEAEMLVSGG